MKIGFRWYGTEDNIPVEYIRHIPNVDTVVTAVYSVKVGEVWPIEDILELKEKANKVGLNFHVVESIPVHEDIKLGKRDYKRYIENYKENIRRCAKAGVKVICYNFMPVFDWTRSELDHKREDGSTCLVFYKDQIKKLDPTKLALPGWDSSYSVEEMAKLINEYKELGEEGLWKNLEYFLKEIIPVAIENDVYMAIHPDDPPYSIFGIPRIITCRDNLRRFLDIYPDKHHGLTMCAGSLGCDPRNDYISMVKEFGSEGRIHFAHLRNIKILEDGSFEESGHITKEGSLDFSEIVKTYYNLGYKGYFRPDHGRMIWGETGKPGYGLCDRALGVAYINGLWEMCEKLKGGKNEK